METYNTIIGPPAPQQTTPTTSEGQEAKKFEAAKNSADEAGHQNG